MRVRPTPRSSRAIADKVSVKKARDEEAKTKTKKVSRRARLEASSSEDEAPTVTPLSTEYFPFDVKEKCHSITTFLSSYERHPENADLSGDMLVALQHELEAMASHSADFARHIQLESAFIQRGVYPLKDTSQRPLPRFNYKSNSPEYSDDDVDLFASAAPVVPPEPEDQLDNWPPEHVAKRFWTWCRHDFLKPIDANFLRDFKASFVEPFTKDNCSNLFINEPWRHRARSKKESPRGKKPKLNRRRSSLVSQNGHKDVKKEDENDNEEESPRRRVSCTSGESSLQLVANVLKTFAEEWKRNGEFDENKLKVIVNNSPKKDGDEDRSVTKDMLCYRLGSSSPKTNGIHATNGHGNGSSNGFINGGLESSEGEGEEDESPCSPKLDGNGSSTPVRKVENGHLNGERIKKRRETVEDCVEEIERDILIETGRSIIMHLTRLGITQKEALEIFDKNSKAVEDGLNELEPHIDHKGHKADETMDEVSVRLMLAQKEMAEALIEYHKAAEDIYGVLEKEFVYQELKRDLDKADDELIQTGVKCYREHPLPRRVASGIDMAYLKPTVEARNRTAALLYGSDYRPLHWQHVDRLKPKNRRLRDQLCLSSPKPSISRVPEGDPYEITDNDYSLPNLNDDDEQNDSLKNTMKRRPHKIIESGTDSEEETQESLPIKMEVDDDDSETEIIKKVAAKAAKYKKSLSPRRHTTKVQTTPKTHMRRC